MDFINLDDLTNGYHERMRRLALMEPLNELASRRTKDNEGESIDMRGLGMLTLLFFFERRLSRHYQTSRQHVTDFLLKITANQYTMTRGKAGEVTDIIFESFRPSAGKRRKLAFFNWNSKEQDEIEYTILKTNGNDAKTDTQYYTLADDGLELLFATKEFYSEFQISINQLLLKQQIEKGEFHDAYRQVREMEVGVSNLIERFEKMRQEIVTSIVSDQTFEHYDQLIKEAHERFARENEEFKSLKQFVQETRDTFYRDDLRQREKASYQLIYKIANELDQVHYEHTRLIELTLELSNTAIETAQQSLYYTGVQSFNFDKDIVANILGKPGSPEIMKGVLHPFLEVEENPRWSLLTILAEQPIIEERKEKSMTDFLQPNEDLQQEEYREWLAEKYGMIMEKFLASYDEKKISTLAAWIEELKKKEPSLIQKRYFYSFWMFMHQMAPLSNHADMASENETISRTVLQALGQRQLLVEELPDIVHVNEKYSIQNMQIDIKENVT